MVTLWASNQFIFDSHIDRQPFPLTHTHLWTICSFQVTQHACFGLWEEVTGTREKTSANSAVKRPQARIPTHDLLAVTANHCTTVLLKSQVISKKLHDPNVKNTFLHSLKDCPSVSVA